MGWDGEVAENNSFFDQGCIILFSMGFELITFRSQSMDYTAYHFALRTEECTLLIV